MKRLTTIFFLLSVFVAAIAQQQKGIMNIEFADGRVVQYDVDDISQVFFTMEDIVKPDVFDIVDNGIPVLVINTPGGVGITSKEEYVENTEFALYRANGSEDFVGGGKIKGRGNTSWGLPKKPYRIKLSSKQSLLGQPADKDWVLLANHFDKTMMRNDLAYFIGKTFGTGMAYVPTFHFVDLVLNGEYVGTYQLGDHLKISEARVNVGSDGYLLEIDGKAAADDITFNTPHLNHPVNIKDPDIEKGSEAYNYVKDFVTTAEAALYGSDFLDPEKGYKKYFDLESFADWYIVNELGKNCDANFHTSCYMNLERGGKLKMGPLWDFDLAFANYPWAGSNQDQCHNPKGFWINKSSWYKHLFYDPAFVQVVRERFEVYYQNRQQIYDHLDETALMLKKSIYTNNKVWKTLTTSINRSEDQIFEKHKTEIKNMKEWLEKRFQWMHSAFAEM